MFTSTPVPMAARIYNNVFHDNKISASNGGAIGVSLNRLITIFSIKNNIF